MIVLVLILRLITKKYYKEKKPFLLKRLYLNKMGHAWM